MTLLQNHLSWEGSFGGQLVQPPCSNRDASSRLPKTVSRQLLKISNEEHSTTSLGSLYQYSVTHTLKKYFWILIRILIYQPFPIYLGQ